MVIKYINIVQSKALQNLPKLGFFCLKSWQPCSRVEPEIRGTETQAELHFNEAIRVNDQAVFIERPYISACAKVDIFMSVSIPK
jgi:hypothetical protein